MSANSQQQLPRVSQEYVDRLIQKLQPPPGMTKQVRFQQLLAAGQLTPQDIAILKAHQARRHAAMSAQRAEGGAPQQGTASQARSLPGKTVPGANNASSPARAASVQAQTRQQQQQKSQQVQQMQQMPVRRPDTVIPNPMGKEQWDKLTPQQKQMYRFKQLRNQARVHKFLEGDADILKKYANEPASLEFHIHDEYFRMGNTDNIISKNNPAMKDFLAYVAKGKLPDSMMEVIKDGGIRLYDGSVILQVYDHRLGSTGSLQNKDSISSQGSQANGDASRLASGSPLMNPANNTNTNTSASGTAKELHAKNPKEYRTILRMTQAAMYEDFSVSVDMKPVPDNFFLTYESEILTTMNRSLNLQPILNPFLVDKSLTPQDEILKPKYNKETDKMEWPCREDARGDNLTAQNYKYKPLHQDMSQSKSTYEKLMLIYSQSTQHSNLPATMNRMTINPIIGEAPRFERFRFIEAYRAEQKKKRDQFKRGLPEQPKLTNGAGMVGYASNGMPMPNGNLKNEPMLARGNSPMMMDPRQQQQQQQVQQQQQQLRQQGKRIKKPTKRGMHTESPIDYDELQQNKRRAPNRRK